MALRRENILALIGKGRYHSAILTTFSFDFIFFEMKAMKWLRSCGVRNVNVFIDGNYYAELMQQLSGEEMKLAPGYSLYPVFEKSIFHPKVWMLFGEKEGLLIIGSGNLTSSGNGNNEEIWAAFHFSITKSDHATIFSEAWRYLQNLCTDIKGFTREKSTRWIADHSKWVTGLPKTEKAVFHQTEATDRVAFLTNSKSETIWQQLTTIIAREKVKVITVISPFYDRKGKAIRAIQGLFQGCRVNIIIDERGSIPAEMAATPNSYFYDWYTLGVSKSLHVKSATQHTKSKLHAKIIHFSTSSAKEFCLFGSANVTPEGLGLPGFNYNAEVSLLLESKQGGILERLGIKLNKPISLTSFKTEQKPSIFEKIIDKNRSKIRLISAEWVYDDLYLFATGEYNQKLGVKLFNAESQVLKEYSIDEFKEEIKIELDSPLKECRSVELFDFGLANSISNRILLSDYSLLAKTHPSPKTEEIEKIYSEIQSGDLTKLLDLLPMALLDEEELEVSSSVVAKGSSHPEKLNLQEKPVQQFDLSKYRQVEHRGNEKNLLHSSLSLRILDILKFIKSKDFAFRNEAELRVDEQIENLGKTEGVGEDEIKISKNSTLFDLKSQQRKLLSFFNKLHEHFQFLLYDRRKPKNYKPTMSDLTKFLISLELLTDYGGKNENYSVENNEHVFTFLDYNGDEPYFNNSVKGCCLNLVGDFLMLARAGFKEYEFEYTQNKLVELKYDALVASITCILNIRWKETEEKYLKCVLLNTLHYLGDRNPVIFREKLSDMYDSLKERKSKLTYQSPIYMHNFNLFSTRAVPAFLRTIDKLETLNFDQKAEKGDVIYKSPWGYCHVKYVSNANDFTLVRPGFMWDNEMGEFINHCGDELYRQLRLSSFIKVEW